MHHLILKYAGEVVSYTVEVDVNDAKFVEVYFSAEWNGHPLISMEWTHKGETHKLIFGS